MENVVLVVHLILALSLIGVVLLQRSEGGGLASNAGGGMAAARPGLTAVGKVTWILAIGFIITSIALTIIAAEKSAGASVLDRIQEAPAAAEEPATDAAPSLGTELLPPSADDGASLTPLAD